MIARYLPSFRSAPRDARLHLPSRGSRGPWVPSFPGPMFREDCHPVLFETLRLSLAPRSLGRFRACVVSPTGSPSGRSPPTAPGPLVARAPRPGMFARKQMALPRPRVTPMHAPLLDPGGVLGTRLLAPRTAAFRPLETVGFPLTTALQDILVSTTLPCSGRPHAACILVPSSSALPLLGVHVEFASDLLARRSSGGT